MAYAYAASNKVVNSLGQSLASRSGGAIHSGHSYIDSQGYISPQLPTSRITRLQANQAAWLHGCMDAQPDKALVGCRTIQIQLSPPPLPSAV